MPTERLLHWIEVVTTWIGSIGSLVAHTIAFSCALLLAAFGVLSWDTILLVLTTVVSLEAIYLAIFIQMTVNQSARSLREVEEDVDEIQKDIDAIEHDVDEIQEDEAQEALRDLEHHKALADISSRLQVLLTDVQNLKSGPNGK